MKKNIWGQSGCLLPDGVNLCESCCVLPQIELGNEYASVIKPANTPCPNLAKIGGCSIHSHKPESCSWHCSMADRATRLDLIAQALSEGKVSAEEAQIASGGVNATDRSTYLQKKTINRDLLGGDIIDV